MARKHKNTKLPPTKATKATERLEELIGEDNITITKYVIIGNRESYNCYIEGESRRYPDGFEGLKTQKSAFLHMKDSTTSKDYLFNYNFELEPEEEDY